MEYYRVYGKNSNSDRYKAVDIEEGCFVNNLINASFFSDRGTADKAVVILNRLNPDMTFETRIVR